MSLVAQLMSETLIIERPGEPVRDSTGSEVPGPPVRITVENSSIMSPYGVTVGSSTETHDASTVIDTRRVFAAPLGTDVRPADKILRGDEVWQAEGEPLAFPLTSLARVEIYVKRVSG
ncbi:hypothetical protein SAM23877_6107 [Streptomyces ambofaciens ATCC 23877]|uniref:Uncharacterized protein n=2 Tax=Streptomyces ambofaciens TaxID=1889 RepID=A0A0K2B238_STRA7|nr:hypothetical protein SAM23877_6107 [Streptomyces ambofaciens ATCC 23877]WNA15345.1 head closure [Streptomyces phage Samy]